MNLGPKFLGCFNVCCYAVLDEQETGLALQHAAKIGGKMKWRKTALNLGSVQLLHRQRMLLCGEANSLHQLAFGRADIEAGAFGQQMFARELFKVIPALEGPA